MKIFGYELSLKKSMQPVPNGSGGWFPLIKEGIPGAWQRGETIEAETALAHSAVFACVSLISSDIGKLPIRFTQNTAGYWPTIEHRYDALIRKPNAYQNRPQFVSAWIGSKLLHGNAYALKVRNQNGVIESLHILAPQVVTPLVSTDGGVFYRLKTSNLAGIGEDVTVPAREIIHDRGFAPFHPLVGISPLMAAGLATTQAISIQRDSSRFFQNSSRPGGVLSTPKTMTQEQGDRLKEYWERNYSGENAGRTAVLGDDLKFSPAGVSALDSQLIEQLNFTAQDVARAYRVPAWKIGAGPSAPYTGVESMNLAYYSDCLQSIIEELELALDDGLGLPPNQRTEFDLDHLLRMDTVSRYAAYTSAIGGGWMAPNEARRKEALPPIEGGDTCYLQQQNYALAALARRDKEGAPQ